MALVGLASVIAFVTAFSVWANRQLLETDNWVETSGEMLEDEEIRDQVATFMVATLYEHVDVQGEIESRLPEDLKGLAGPAAGGVRQLVDELAHEALERPQVQSAWETLNRAAHARFIEVVKDRSDEPVTLDLATLIEEIGREAGIDVEGKLPASAGEIEVLPGDKLTTAQRIVSLIEELALWLGLVALALFGLAIYLARGWRREALKAVGFALIAVGLAVTVARSLGGGLVVEQLASTPAIEPAVHNAYEIGTGLLADGAGAAVLYGILILIGAWLAGPGDLATFVRRELTPLLERRDIAYSALLVLLLLLFWWAPTDGFRNLGTSLVIIALFAIGWEGLRRRATAEFPEETWDSEAERWRQRARALIERGRQRL